jgi:N-acetylglucosamine-6-sulfatase
MTRPWLRSLPLLVLTVLAAAGAAAGEPRSEADVVVVGATPAGIAAAVAAARGGATVTLVEELAHVGGVIAGGLSNVDNVRKEAIGGLFNEFKRRVVEHYVAAYGRDSQQVKDCRGGNDFEPWVAERVFGGFLAGEKRITVLLRHRVRGVRKTGPRLDSIVVAPLDGGEPVEIAGRVFIDATYEGDLAALAGAPCRIGRESRSEYGEPLAGRIYMEMTTKKVLPGSTGEGDRGIQAFTYRFPLTADPASRVPIEKPEGYDAADYRDLLADVEEGHVKRLRDVIQMRRAPNGKVVVNNDHMKNGHPRQSLDLAEENWDWPDGTPETRDRIRRRYWTYCEGLLWFLQHDPRVPEAVRQEAGQWGFCKDEFPDNRHRPWQIYVREARRIVGEATFTARDTEPDPTTGKPRPVADAIALVEYGFDSHAVHKFDPAHPLAREGYFGVGHPPTQLPYGVVVPRDVDGLLVPVACSASRLGYQTIRMEPVFMALGEACGIAATTALAAGGEVRSVDVSQVQQEIIARGGVISLGGPGKPAQPAAAAAESAPPVRRWNIIFVLTDDQRHDLMGCAGHPFVETPALDALARDGVRFRNAFVTTSLCSPSRASILTGHYAHTHGVIDNTAGFRPGTVMFPELLQQAGYRTGFFGKWHIGETSDAPQPGFDRWVSFRGHGSYLPGRSRPDRPPAMLNVDGRAVPQKDYITDELTEYCLEWLSDAAKEGRPFFAYLSHKGIHGNFQPAARHVGRYRDAPLPPLVANPEKPDAASRKPLWVRNQRNSWHGAEFAFQDTVPIADLYRSQCEALLSVDESVARIRSWLAKNGLADSTLIVYMGDNGFLWGEHGLVDKRTAYEESMRVPLLGVCPGVWPAGTVRDEMVAGIDIAPTFLAAAGIAPPATMAGRSFLELATGRAIDPPWRDRLLYEYFWEYTFPHTPTMFCLRTTTHKFIQYHGIWDLDELYDLEADPREQRNLVLDPDQAATVASWRAEMAALLAVSGITSVPFSPKGSHGNSLRLGSGSAEAAFPPEWIQPDPAAARTSP